MNKIFITWIPGFLPVPLIIFNSHIQVSGVCITCSCIKAGIKCNCIIKHEVRLYLYPDRDPPHHKANFLSGCCQLFLIFQFYTTRCIQGHITAYFKKCIVGLNTQFLQFSSFNLYAELEIWIEDDMSIR